MLCLLVLALGSVAHAEKSDKMLKRSDACNTQDAHDFLDDKAQALLKEIREQQKALVEKESRRTQLKVYKDILAQTFAYDAVARSLLGPYWRKLSPSQREEYTTLMTKILEHTISNAIYNLPVRSYELLNISRLGKDFAVTMAVVVEDKPEPLSIVWRVRCFERASDDKTAMGVIDVIFRSVSVIAGKRGELTGIIAKQGVGQFLQTLGLERDRLARQEREGS